MKWTNQDSRAASPLKDVVGGGREVVQATSNDVHVFHRHDMIEKKKQAYRRLLYMAMLDIRPLQWTVEAGNKDSISLVGGVVRNEF